MITVIHDILNLKETNIKNTLFIKLIKNIEKHYLSFIERCEILHLVFKYQHNKLKGCNMKDDYLKLLKDKEFLKSKSFKKLKKEFNDFIKNE